MSTCVLQSRSSASGAGAGAGAGMECGAALGAGGYAAPAQGAGGHARAALSPTERSPAKSGLHVNFIDKGEVSTLPGLSDAVRPPTIPKRCLTVKQQDGDRHKWPGAINTYDIPNGYTAHAAQHSTAGTAHGSSEENSDSRFDMRIRRKRMQVKTEKIAVNTNYVGAYL